MSKLLERAVGEFSKLPGIGERTAMRLVLHLLSQPEIGVSMFANSISDFRKNIKFCSVCNNLSDNDICPICSDNTRDKSVVCVVEHVKDVMSIEQTGKFRGVYHVLGGLISPMNGVGPSSLKIDLLTSNVVEREVKEVVLALSTSIEGETTSFFIAKKLENTGVQISTIARGVGFGDDLDYADDLTLMHAFNNRVKFTK
ncbi:MAG: recombination mediator RecR [Rikenellaceae bacterium]